MDINVLISDSDFALRSPSAIGIEGTLERRAAADRAYGVPLDRLDLRSPRHESRRHDDWEGTLIQHCCDQYAYTFGGPGGFPVVDLVLTPEPGTFALLGLGLAGWRFVAKRGDLIGREMIRFVPSSIDGSNQLAQTGFRSHMDPIAGRYLAPLFAVGWDHVRSILADDDPDPRRGRAPLREAPHRRRDRRRDAQNAPRADSTEASHPKARPRRPRRSPSWTRVETTTWSRSAFRSARPSPRIAIPAATGCRD